MKVTYHASDKFTVEFDANNHKEVFGQVARFEEVFSNTVCGLCGSDDVHFVVRNITKGSKNFAFHEVRCQNPKCRAKLDFGELADNSGNMFPKRKDDAGNIKGKYGWYQWNGNAPATETPPDTGDDDVPF